MIEGEFKGLNLTRILGEEEFFQKQIKDSLIPLEHSSVFNQWLSEVDLLVDIGFGGGLPLLPLAKALPQKKFLGFEARKKKALAVQSIANTLGIKNVKTFHQRCELVLWDRPSIVTFKAVSTVEDCLSLLNFTSPIAVFFYKGPHFHENEDIGKVLKNWDLIEERFEQLEGTDGRLILGFTPKNVPCGTNKKLAKLSEFH